MKVGLTGGIASGKSTVARHLAARGAFVVDADAVARELTGAAGPLVDALVDVAGPGVRDAAGGLDRARLAEVVFADPEIRHRVEALLHPAIRTEVMRRLEAERNAAVVVVEAALLVETGRRLPTDVLLVVEAPREVKLARQAARDRRSEADASARLDAQAAAGVKVLAADLVVWNDGTERELIARANEVWAVLAAWAERKPS